MKRDEIIKVSEEDILRQQVFINHLREFFEEAAENKQRAKKFFIQTYGCQMNEHDSETISGMFELMGLSETREPEEADLIIYNTCAVRENAELKVYGNLHILKKFKEKNPDLIIAVCGCMMQQPHVIEEIKKRYAHVNLIFGTHNLYKLPQMLHSVVSDSKEMLIDVWDIDGRIVEGLPSSRKYDIKSFVNIMYGCNNFCTYCIVPFTRGRERSRLAEDIIKEVKELTENGVREITLLGQNVNSYGNHFEPKYSFADLLRDLNKLDKLERIRFMTPHPKDISDDLIDAIAELDKVCESIHLPLQSGSSRVLRAMNRSYTKEDYLKIIDKIKTKIKGVSLTTDIMIGFPGETEEDFLDTLDVVEKVRYDSAFTFIYSVRKGTVAERMQEHIPEEIKKDRFNRLLEVVNKISAEKNREYNNRIVEVLVEGVSKKDSSKWMGRTRENKLVNFSGTAKVGEIVRVQITDPKSFSLNGRQVDIE